MLTTRSLNSTLNRMLTLNRALDQALATPWESAVTRTWVPALDVVERKDAYLITMDLPGVDPRDVEVNFEQNVLTIRGTKAAAKEQEDVRIYASERVTGTFERAVRLPDFVNGDAISAEYAHGVLHVTVPKAQAAQPRKIEVRPAAAAPVHA
ncbi:MAG TPA: Hsp20/alpha crystallin family protein [Gemmatimonadaceae bacterium]|jgi:HSP20 family protein|nr:Hsp20/alpha crystallin family protein [Gemmatimonadaceae bacterium]